MHDAMKQLTLYLTRRRWYATDPAGQRRSGERGGDAGQVLDGLEAVFEAPASRRCRVKVVLSCACVRFLVLPWNSAVHTGRGMSEQVHKAWQRESIDFHTHQIRVLWPGYGMPLVSAAYPRELTRGLIEQFPGRAGKLAGIDCSVIGMTARHLRTSGRQRQLLMFQEEDGYSGVHVQAGEVVNIEQLPVNGQGLDALPVWLGRKQLDYPDADNMLWLAAMTATDAQVIAPVAAVGLAGGAA